MVRMREYRYRRTNPIRLRFDLLVPSPTLSVALQGGVTSNRESKEIRGPNQSLWTMARYWIAPCDASGVITVLWYIVLHTGTC
jgi:hypothetical protein